jgi:hypothetical protein
MVKIALHITPLETTSLPQENQDSKCVAFRSFMKYRKAAPPGFDYKKNWRRRWTKNNVYRSGTKKAAF